MNHTDKGKFKKGERTVGRQKGVPNKLTAEMRATISQLVESNFNQTLLDDLPPDKKVDVLLRLLPYILPKYADLPTNEPSEDKVVITINSPLTNDD
jgi:hypothetical protein